MSATRSSTDSSVRRAFPREMPTRRKGARSPRMNGGLSDRSCSCIAAVGRNGPMGASSYAGSGTAPRWGAYVDSSRNQGSLSSCSPASMNLVPIDAM